MTGLSFNHHDDWIQFRQYLLQLFPQAVLCRVDQQQQLIEHYRLTPAQHSRQQWQNPPGSATGSAVVTCSNQHNQPVSCLQTWQRLVIHQPQFMGFLWILQPCQKQHDMAPAQVSPADQNLIDTFHSQAPAMQHMCSIIQRVAVTEFPVLVRGETGSGKELVAQAIHQYSQRKNQVFVAINCAALNASLLESELFGHVKGAFTGAIREHKGVFERAAGGTLFLDEIAEIPLELQAKLLRVLESGEFTRLGGEQPIKANVRIIAATHRALREEARQGRFRQDLLYRLRVIPIFVPPLRHRKMDIPLLIQAIFKQNVLDQRMRLPLLTPSALQVLMAYDWPGNVRELKNTLLYALTMSQGEAVIDVPHLPHEIVHLTADITTAEPVGMPAHQVTAQQVQNALNNHQYQLNPAAQALGISRTTLWRYRKKFGL